MDEVDTIILQNLRVIGTNIPDDVVRLKGMFLTALILWRCRVTSAIRGLIL